jgi:hypothetical protein
LKKETCLAGFQGTPESRAVKARATSLRCEKCGNIFVALPGERCQSPMKSMLSQQCFDKR